MLIGLKSIALQRLQVCIFFVNETQKNRSFLSKRAVFLNFFRVFVGRSDFCFCVDHSFSHRQGKIRPLESLCPRADLALEKGLN